MSGTTLTFFTNKGGVGKTALVYHVAWMLSELDHVVLAVDLDPQANLTAAFLDEHALVELWEDSLMRPQLSIAASNHSRWSAISGSLACSGYPIACICYRET